MLLNQRITLQYRQSGSNDLGEQVGAWVSAGEPWANQSPSAAQYSQSDTGALIVQTPDFSLPVGASMTSLIWSLQVSFAAASGGATIKLGRVSVRRRLPFMA